VRGYCNGTLTLTKSAPYLSTFEGQSALSASSVSTFNYWNCFPSFGSSVSLSFYNSNYEQIGLSSDGTYYGVLLNGPARLPTWVRVGDFFVIGTMTAYSNPTKTILSGRQDLTLFVEADTATTAIANFVSQSYNAAGTLMTTEQNRYRITTEGRLSHISFDIQYENGSLAWLFGS
jgi:hypothetical protein